MPRHVHFTIFFIISLALHALILAALFLISPGRTPLPVSIPVDIVELPKDLARRAPPLRQPPPPPRRVVPEKPLPPSKVPKPEKFGPDDDVTLPKTAPPPPAAPEGTREGREPATEAPREAPRQEGPLPFLTQRDIDELARKGMPKKKPGDDSVTLDTDEFKFISYNRWLKIKVESVLKYPELAAVSGYQGTLYIQFDIMKDGSLGRFEVLKPSGYKILDDEAERAIRASAPFQPLPDEWDMERYSIRAAVVFYLGTGYIR